MPGFDGTGPMGMGPMTGGGRGFCSPYGIRASRRPYGIRRWAGYDYPIGAAPSREQEISYLENEAQALRKTLEEIDARVRELGREK
jgi:hypothetical protein